MNNNELMKKAKEIVDELITEKVSFTAYDITKIIRKNGCKVKHENVNKQIKEMFSKNQLTNYKKTLINFFDNNTSAFLYHHVNEDPTDFQSDWVEKTQTQLPNKTNTAIDDNATDVNNDSTPGGLTVNLIDLNPNTIKNSNKNKEKRLEVPQTHVKTAGFDAHEKICAVQKPHNEIVLISEKNKYKLDIQLTTKTIKVDKNSRIRMSLSTLRQLNKNINQLNKNAYNFSSGPEVIYIKNYS